MANFANYGNLESILTGYANKINGISEVVPSNATSSNKLATQSDLPSAVTGNPEGSATAGNLTKLQIGSDIYDVPSGGSGNTVSKTRYQISSSSWSSSANSDGFYTLTATLNPAIGSSPDVYVAGSADGTQPTDTQKTQFSYLKRCKVNGSTLTLYASSKPSSTFYIWVEGVNGTGSGDIVGNVIQPNGANGGGATTTDISSSIAETQLVGTVSNKYAVRYGNVISFILRGTIANPLPSLPDMDEIFTGFPKPIYSTWFEMVEVDFSAPSLMALVNVNQGTGGVRVGGGVRANMAGKSFIISGTYVCAN